MNQQGVYSSKDENQGNISTNINCMSTINTYIDYSSSNFKIDQKLYDLEEYDIGKYIIEDFKKRRASLEEIQAIYFDKTIFSLLERQKLTNRDYLYLFYFFFLKDTYRYYIIQLGHKNFSKFFKKYFNSCMKSKLFENYEIVGFIEFYLLSLYQLITGCPKESNISELQKKPLINLQNLDSINKKYMTLLVKYIMAFCDILGYTIEYKDYHQIIFNIFASIKDNLFKEIFMKQLNKLFLNKGLYSFKNNFIQQILYPVLYKNNKLSTKELSISVSYFINSILYYRPKYLINNNNKLLYSTSSPFYFLNMTNLVKIIKEMVSNDDMVNNLLLKFTDIFNQKINFFIDDNNKIIVSEYLLIDSLNNKLIINLLDSVELIKPYFKNNIDKINLNNDYYYFDYLLYYISMDKYIIYYLGNNNKNMDINNNNNTIDTNLNNSLYSQDNDFFNDNISKIKNENDYIELIINKFNNSNDYFINKYFKKKNENNIDVTEIILKKSIEELNILLNILYSISIRFTEEEILQNCIIDIRKIITSIIQKSFEGKKFNCVIFDFINNIDKKYLPPESEFDIMTSNVILTKISFEDFIKTYPLFLIFVLNYFPRHNSDISQFFIILKSFMVGYYKNVFNSIDEDMNLYNHTLQINYLNIIYLIIEEILNIYNIISKNNNINNSNNDIYINKEIIQYLSYCLNCQKKIKKPIIFSSYLSQCTYCGEMLLYINTNLYDYLNKYRDELKQFIDDCIYTVITGITCNILYKFNTKYENRNINSMFCYNLYYKIMSEHFQFLNDIKVIIGKNIPFVVEPNSDINNKEGALEEYINSFFEKYITNKSKYPFKRIYENINNDEFESFNSYRKTIKHECELSKYKYN